jgi:DNA-binding LytR/AlgR family response regulator
MNCIIGADIKNSQIIEEFVRKTSFLDLVGTYYDSDSIRQQLSNGKNTELYIIDLEIHDLDFFNFISTINNPPNIILISESVHNALKAFDLNVIDFLLKPVSYARFFRAVDKAIRYHSPNESKQLGTSEIYIKKGSSLVKLRLTDLVYIEALENYITLHTKDDKFTIHFTMKAIETQLSPDIFIRVHRSFLVNKNMIQAVREDTLELVHGNKIKNVPIGNSFRETLFNNLNMMVR